LCTHTHTHMTGAGEKNCINGAHESELFQLMWGLLYSPQSWNFIICAMNITQITP